MPLLERASISEPAPSRDATSFARPLRAAAISAVDPSAPASFGSARAASSSDATAPCPSAAAKPSAVRPSSPRASGFAPAASSLRTISACPFHAARVSAV
jgi:hypothetical protein